MLTLLLVLLEFFQFYWSFQRMSLFILFIFYTAFLFLMSLICVFYYFVSFCLLWVHNVFFFKYQCKSLYYRFKHWFINLAIHYKCLSNVLAVFYTPYFYFNIVSWIFKNFSWFVFSIAYNFISFTFLNMPFNKRIGQWLSFSHLHR